MSVGDAHMGFEVLCPSCAGPLLFERAPAFRKPPAAKSPLYLPQWLQIAGSLLGALIAAGLFVIDTPDQAKVAELQRKLDDWLALRRKFEALADANDTLSYSTTGRTQTRTIFDAATSRHNVREASERIRELSSDLQMARSSARVLWAFGFCTCVLIFIHGALRRRKTA